MKHGIVAACVEALGFACRPIVAGVLCLVAVAGATGPARADLAGVIAQAVENSLNGMNGTEVQSESSTNVLGVDLTLNLLGFAFCLPPVPTAAPSPTPVPPANAYGCVNAAQVGASLRPDYSGGELTIPIGTLFIDLETRRERTLYCGDFGSGTVIRQGYMLTDCVVHADYTLVTQGNCRQIQLGTVTSGIGAIDSHFGDSCLNTWADIVAITLDLFESSFDPYFQELLAVAVADANPEICALTQGADVPGATISRLRLYPCEPNPFNPRTTIKFDLPEAGPVRLTVFDLAGRLVRTLVDDSMPQGSHEAVWDGRDSSGREVGSGTYLARLEFAGKVETVRMGLVR